MSTLDRRNVVRVLLHERGDLLVVAGLGAPAYDVAACGNAPLDFPLWGAMGGAAMVGLGLALARPQQPVLVLTGDGEMLMGLGSLATIASQQPPNLRIVVLDNEQYGETGQQATHTARDTDLAAVARACGFAEAVTVRETGEVEALRDRLHAADRPLFAAIKVTAGELPRALPPRDGAYLTHRMREALLGVERALEG